MILISREQLLEWRKEWMAANPCEDGHDHVTPFDVALMQTDTSEVTRQLIQRDQAGLRKYGTSLDRKDLCAADWAQHMAEELLDAAGYVLALKRELMEPAPTTTAFCGIPIVQNDALPPDVAVIASPESAGVEERARFVVELIRCDCHPETCCCSDARLRMDGESISTGSFEAMQRIADKLAAALRQQPVQGGSGRVAVAQGFYDPITGAYSEDQHTPRWLPCTVVAPTITTPTAAQPQVDKRLMPFADGWSR